jgi:hypothetical protein
MLRRLVFPVDREGWIRHFRKQFPGRIPRKWRRESFWEPFFSVRGLSARNSVPGLFWGLSGVFRSYPGHFPRRWEAWEDWKNGRLAFCTSALSWDDAVASCGRVIFPRCGNPMMWRGIMVP